MPRASAGSDTGSTVTGERRGRNGRKLTSPVAAPAAASAAYRSHAGRSPLVARQNTPTSLSPPGRHTSPSRDCRTRTSSPPASSYSTYGSGIATSGSVSPTPGWAATTSRTVAGERPTWSPQTTRIVSYAAQCAIAPKIASPMPVGCS